MSNTMEITISLMISTAEWKRHMNVIYYMLFLNVKLSYDFHFLSYKILFEKLE